MGDYRAVRKLPSPQKAQVYTLNSEYLLKDGKIGADISLSNYDINLFSSKDSDQNLGYAARIFGNKTFTKNSWKGTPSFEYQYIEKQFHILDRINDVEFSRDFNLAKEFNGLTQNRFIFSFFNKWNNKSTLNYRINYLDEQDSYKGTKNDLDFGWIKGKFNTKGIYLTLIPMLLCKTQNSSVEEQEPSTPVKKEAGQWAEVWSTMKKIQ